MSETPHPSVYPAPPEAEEIVRPYALIGPTKLTADKLQVCYRIIDRSTTRSDAYAFPGKEHEFTEKTSVIIMLTGEDDERLAPLARNLFAEFKRRLIYHANKEWEKVRDKAEATARQLVEPPSPVDGPVLTTEQGELRRFGYWYRIRPWGLTWVEGARHER